jgi:hypothetical protein
VFIRSSDGCRSIAPRVQLAGPARMLMDSLQDRWRRGRSLRTLGLARLEGRADASVMGLLDGWATLIRMRLPSLMAGPDAMLVGVVFTAGPACASGPVKGLLARWARSGRRNALGARGVDSRWKRLAVRAHAADHLEKCRPGFRRRSVSGDDRQEQVTRLLSEVSRFAGRDALNGRRHANSSQGRLAGIGHNFALGSQQKSQRQLPVGSCCKHVSCPVLELLQGRAGR